MKSYRPHLTVLQIVNMSFGFFGIQFGFALQNANTSWIFTSLGAEVSELAILWIAAPVTGLLVQPIIGYYSDRTWHATWGRRRPYFAFGALLASISLFLMPNSSTLWMAAGVLWMMDASINISMEPFRAFVGDMLPPSQRASGFAMQSFFIGLGAVIASSLPSILSSLGVADTADGNGVPGTVKYSFYFGGVVLFAAVMYTVFTTKEYPPDEDTAQRQRTRESTSTEAIAIMKSRFAYLGVSLASIGVLAAAAIYWWDLVKDLYVLAGGFLAFGVIHLVASWLTAMGKHESAVVDIVRDFNAMPKTMKQLAVVQFFSWFALFAMWIFTTSAVTSHLLHTTDPQDPAYSEGGKFVGNLFSGYNGVAAVAALFLPTLAKWLGIRKTHLVALVCGALGLASFYFVPSLQWLWLSMVGVGIAWASILSMPYALLAGALPPEKMGYYMGVFNFFIVIPQIIAAACLGVIVKFAFHDQSIYVLLLGGACMLLAGFLTLTVDEKR